MLKSVSEYLDSRLEGCWHLWNLDSVDRQEKSWDTYVGRSVQSDLRKWMNQMNGRLQYRAESTLTVYEAK